jgi:prevent-host-death family protein
MTDKELGVAEAKKRFSELIDRVRQGERFVIHRRGKPAVALVSPDEILRRLRRPPIGLAAVAGALSDWDDIEEAVEGIYAMRGASPDRSVPDLE